jgi:uncharacterized protein YeaO (DUF488 family)
MAALKADIRVRRVYDEPEDADGTRVLVDRVWPRGLSKDDARLDAWRKDVAPSSELRRWYGHSCRMDRPFPVGRPSGASAAPYARWRA